MRRLIRFQRMSVWKLQSIVDSLEVLLFVWCDPTYKTLEICPQLMLDVGDEVGDSCRFSACGLG